MSWWTRVFQPGTYEAEIDIKVFGDAPYTKFTTKYDVTVGPTAVYDVSSPDSRYTQAHFEKNQRFVSDWYAKFAREILSLKQDVKSKLTNCKYTDCLITVLMDHSGSLKGDKQYIACLLAKELDAAFLSNGFAFEMLGYTTRNWRGGMSRDKWLKSGSPKMPGRLCDLLHIEYRAWADKTEQDGRYNILLDTQILKENIDGEAIEWARQRFEASPFSRHLIIMISDGAPVDDSTLTQNPHDILVNHLSCVIEDYEMEKNKAIIGFGIGYNVGNYFKSSAYVKDLSEFPEKFRALVDKVNDRIIYLNKEN